MEAHKLNSLHKEDFDYFCKKILHLSGIFLADNKMSLVEARLTNRVVALNLKNLTDYKNFLSTLPSVHPEWQLFTNELTTNKTNFFRERQHFDYLVKNYLPDWNKKNPKATFQVWSAACSTGEEPYSLAMVLQDFFKDNSRYRIVASDLDTQILATAKNGVYRLSTIEEIPDNYKKEYIHYGTKEIADWIKVSDVLRSRIDYRQVNLTEKNFPNQKFDLILCRNVFIYFEPKTIESIIKEFDKLCKPESLMIIGRSETLHNVKHSWLSLEPSVFAKKEKSTAATVVSNEVVPIIKTQLKKKSRVLIVDDSPTIQQLLTKIIKSSHDLEVVGTVTNPTEVEAAIEKFKPDVVTLDIHMPGRDGCQVLESILPKYKIPTVMISALSIDDSGLVLKALELGAVDYIQKPAFSDMATVASVLIEKIVMAASVKVKNYAPKSRNPVQKIKAVSADFKTVIAVGSSTGGTEALKEILMELPAQIPPILIAQHIPAVFSKAFAERMNSLCAFEVKEAEHHDAIKSGRVLVAPGGFQMGVEKYSDGFRVVLSDAPAVNRHKPSVDFLFDSVAEVFGSQASGVILTGMGTDGAKGLLKMRHKGSHTLAQDEESCAVFGMPKEAIRLGAAEEVCSLPLIAKSILKWSPK